MLLDTLKNKALSLPLSPGVYLMKDASGDIIYVGKAKKLKNRVSQYFQDTASHTPKTRAMVSKVADFDVIVARSEFEALVLECSQIKQHSPKYNILLKDDKGFPFIRLDMSAKYPVLSIASKAANDGASYFGPFGSRSATQDIIKTISQTLKLPTCSKKFPRDIGKDRPCLNYHMAQCEGWCQGALSQKEYYAVMKQVKHLLSGDYKTVASEIESQMHSAAEELQFELAAKLRDRLHAVEKIGRKQLVNAVTSSDMDVVGFAQTDTKMCFTILRFGNGNLLDKYFTVFPVPDNAEAAISSLVKQYYLALGVAPKRILMPFQMEDQQLFEQLLTEKFNLRVKIVTPQKGDKAKLVELATKNAYEEAQRLTEKDAHINTSLEKLKKMLALDSASRIESFDISNISGTDIVAGMVVFLDGKPRPGEYKRFKITGLSAPDDYASMEMALRRRFLHYVQNDKGFDKLPDLLLIDGGIQHAQTALAVLNDLSLSVPIFGMVKDDRHRTRALVTPEGQEISISTQQSVYALIGNIQEETHRFAITYHKTLRRKRLKYSELDKISGIGKKRKEDLLKTFKSITAIRQAQLIELERILPKDAARAVYDYYNDAQKE